MKTRKELKEAGFTDRQIDDLIEKGICLFNCKSDIERIEKERNSPKCYYCGRSIVKPDTVFVYRRTDDNIYCSDECARRDGNFCVGAVYSFEGKVYERYFANQEGRQMRRKLPKRNMNESCGEQEHSGGDYGF